MASSLKTQCLATLWILFQFFILESKFIVVTSQSSPKLMALDTTLMANQTQTLVSSNGMFEIGFHSIETKFSTKYTLAIWYAITLPLETIVWEADDSMSLSSNAYLFLSKEGDLQVFDNNLTMNVWSSRTSKLNVVEAILLDTGNFVLRDKNENHVWESFDSPTHTLLPTQQFKQKDNLLMHAMIKEGPWKNTRYIMGWYTAFNTSFLYITWESSTYLQENKFYWTSNITSYDRDLSYVVLSTEGDFTGIYKDSIGVSDFLDFSYYRATKLQGRMHRLTLDPDGNLRIYSWYIGSSTTWDITWTALLDTCKIFGFCGPYAWCDNGNCYCPKGFRYVNPTNKFLGCERITPLTCSGTKNSNTMVELPSIDYPFGKGDYLNSTNLLKEECIKNCLAFCLCQGVTMSLPNTSTGNVSCSLKSGILINGEVDRNHITYIRIEPQISNKPGISRQFILILVLSILIPIMFILTIISGVFCHTFIRKKSKEFQRKKFETKWSIAHGTIAKITYKEIRLMTNNFAEQIGKGGYGTVFKGEIGCNKNTKQVVAVKQLDKLNVEDVDFTNEVNIIGHIHHVNLVHLLGYCVEKNHKILIYEYMEQHSLDKILFRKNNAKAIVLDWRTRYNIAVEIARGLAYLHDDIRDQRIIHCDVKPENILLDSMFCAKVADFGLSRIMNRDQTRTMTKQIRGTYGYMAPEWISDQMSITTKVDVYSYGMVLLEIIGGRRNLETSLNHVNELKSDFYFPLWAYSRMDDVKTIFEILDPLLQGLANSSELHRALRIAFWCINDLPNLRPSMSMVVQMLEGHMPIEYPVPQPQYFSSMFVEDDDDENLFTSSRHSLEDGQESSGYNL